MTLVDDTVHEEDEEFRLVLGTAKSKSPYGASVGEQKEALVTITDHKDSEYIFSLFLTNISIMFLMSLSQRKQNYFSTSESIIRFAEIKYSVREPQLPGEIAVVKIPVLRQGDTSKVSVVRIHTKDGSATSGEDYNPLSQGQQKTHEGYKI